MHSRPAISRPVSAVMRTEPRLVYLAPGDVTKGRIEPIYWMQTCCAFAEHGLNVHLVALRVRMPDAIDPSEIWDHFGVRPFRLTRVPTLLSAESTTFAFQFWAASISTAAALTVAASRRGHRGTTVIYSKSPALLSGFVNLRPILPRRLVLVMELHALPTTRATGMARRADLIVASSTKLADDLVDAFRIDRSKILVEQPVAPVDAAPIPKAEARAKLGISADSTVACYTGKFVDDQIDFLLRSAIPLKQTLERFRLLLVGGNPRARCWVARRARDLGVSDVVQMPGFVPPSRVRLYQAAADVLLLHLAESAGTWQHATPAKAFDYMAAGRPIVSTSFPLFSEVFGCDGSRAVRVEHDPEQYADAVVRTLAAPDVGVAMAQRAADWISSRSWQKRTERVLAALEAHDGYH
jgi:glycosyltransferase involved in cell wall biosynthesis